MNDLFIGKRVAYAAKDGGGTIAGSWELTSLTDGAIALFDKDGTIIAANASSITSAKLTLATTTSTNGTKVLPILKSGFSYTKQTYVAPVKATKFLGSEEAAAAGTYSLNLPSSLKVGDMVAFGIINSSYPTEDLRRYRYYEHTVVSGDLLTGKSAKNVIAILVAKVNADEYRAADAVAQEDGSNNIDGIKFTAVTAGVDFKVFRMDGILKDADITDGTANNIGQGTPAQVAEIARQVAHYDGDNNYMKYDHLLFTEPSPLGASETYTVYTLYTAVESTDALIVPNKAKLKVAIAVPSGQTGAGEIVTVLDALLAKI